MARNVYTTKEAAKKLGVTPTRVRQLILDGTLPSEKFGRDLMITEKAIEKAKRRKKVPGPASSTKLPYKKKGPPRN
jgi:excisionase family DNA binding protein